jgi:hypothetical protein
MQSMSPRFLLWRKGEGNSFLLAAGNLLCSVGPEKGVKLQPQQHYLLICSLAALQPSTSSTPSTPSLLHSLHSLTPPLPPLPPLLHSLHSLHSSTPSTPSTPPLPPALHSSSTSSPSLSLAFNVGIRHFFARRIQRIHNV